MMPGEDTCPSCRGRAVEVFYEVRGIPVHDVLLMPTAQIALGYPQGDVALGLCRGCGFIFNTRFDPRLPAYSSECEETQGFSPTFQEFHRRLARRLVDTYGLRGKDLLEIGCGKGEFLALLCEMGENRGVGFDPAYVAERLRSPAAERIRFVSDFYSDRYAGCKADFVVCKMTLEHIPATRQFVAMLRRAGSRERPPVVFVQVPNVRPILRELRFWDVYYEHCSYFSSGSLARLFERAGFDIVRLGTEYAEQYLTIEARRAEGDAASGLAPEDDVEDLAKEARRFGQRCRERLSHWRQDLERLRQEGRRAVVWGGGSKAVAFLTTLKVGEEVRCVVDINPYRQNTYLAGTGHPIVAPEALRECRPDVVIVMNPVYRDEVGRELQRLGLGPRVLTV